MDRTYGYDECEIELSDRALYGYNSDDYVITILRESPQPYSPYTSRSYSL